MDRVTARSKETVGRYAKGGIVVYDDYGFSACEGITRYVNEQVKEADRVVLHNLNGHAIVIKTSVGPVTVAAEDARPASVQHRNIRSGS